MLAWRFRDDAPTASMRREPGPRRPNRFLPPDAGRWFLAPDL